jgi:hypothetical protein
LQSSLAGYFAPIHFAKEVLTQAERQAYWLTKAGGDLDKKPEAELETETNTITKHPFFY